MVSISVIVPTCGRLTLKRALDSVVPQLGDADEILVVGDGRQPSAARCVAAMADPRLRYFEYGPTGFLGNAQRNMATKQAKGEMLSFLDDDDYYAPTALEDTHVGRGASIGAGTIILPGVSIGAGAMIAAGSLVETSIPAGSLYTQRNGHSQMKRWYATQAEIGLPWTFDEWRERYTELSYADQLAFYDAIYQHFPQQQHANLTAVREFFCDESAPCSVLEIGGWDGTIAGTVLEEFPQVQQWFNFELCRKAITHGLQHPRYTGRVFPDFVWKVPELPRTEVFFAAHTIEHMRAEELQQLLARLTTVKRMYLEAPIPNAATDHQWSGRWNTHILEIGWQEIEELAATYGFHVTNRACDLRFFQR